MKWINYNLIVLISVGIGFVFGRYSIEGTQNYIIPILPWALLVSVTQLVFNMGWGFYQNKVKQKEKLEQDEAKKHQRTEQILLDHSVKAVNANLSIRAESILQLNTGKCGLFIQVYPEPTTLEYKTYNEDVNDHLQNGYSEVWATLLRRTSLIEQHNTEAELFLNELKSKILIELEKIPKIVTQDGHDEQTYYPEQLYQIGCGIEWFYNHPVDKNKLSNELLVFQGGELWKLYKNQDLVISKDEVMIRNLKEKIVKILIEAIESARFTLLKKCFEDANENHRIFLKEINEIKILVQTGIPLNYECGIEKKVIEYGNTSRNNHKTHFPQDAT